MLFNQILYQFSSLANKNNIDNSYDDEIREHIEELDAFLEVANKSWDKYCLLNGIVETPLYLGSAYRCAKLNKLMDGSDISPHLKGYAADILIEDSTLWPHFYKWAASFAIECVKNSLYFNEIMPESSGSMNWIHISLKDYYGNQQMKTIAISKTNDLKYYPVTFGTPVDYTKLTSSTELTSDPYEKLISTNTSMKYYDEIEGIHNNENIDFSSTGVPGSYLRCVYIMKKLIDTYAFTIEQAAGILGNILYDTNGRIGTNIVKSSRMGICQWSYAKNVEFRKCFRYDKTIAESNLLTQVEFLLRELAQKSFYKKIKIYKSRNDSCLIFFKNYLKKDETIDMNSTSVRKELSERRAYATAAFEVYNNFFEKIDDADTFLKSYAVGYYEGNGVNDGSPIYPTDDTKLWQAYNNEDYIPNYSTIDDEDYDEDEEDEEEDSSSSSSYYEENQASDR